MVSILKIANYTEIPPTPTDTYVHVGADITRTHPLFISATTFTSAATPLHPPPTLNPSPFNPHPSLPSISTGMGPGVPWVHQGAQGAHRLCALLTVWWASDCHRVFWCYNQVCVSDIHAYTYTCLCVTNCLCMCCYCVCMCVSRYMHVQCKWPSVKHSLSMKLIIFRSITSKLFVSHTSCICCLSIAGINRAMYCFSINRFISAHDSMRCVFLNSLGTWYLHNGSTRYDGKEYSKSISKLRRESSAIGPLKAGETITIETKSRVWKVVMVSLDYQPPQKMRR